jgi:hypothetical protein
MIAIPVSSPEQFILQTIFEQAKRTSEISDTGIEIEQKYLFLLADDKKCTVEFAQLEISVRRFFSSRRVEGVAQFDGVDHYFTVKKGNSVIPFRYRMGNMVSNRLGVKVKKSNDGLVRQEVEFQVRDDMDIEKVFQFLRIVGSLGDSYEEKHIWTRGNIRHETLRSGRRVEVVIYIVTNTETGQAALIAEIEVHGFQNEAEARKDISRFEDALGWKGYRTDKSVSTLI